MKTDITQIIVKAIQNDDMEEKTKTLPFSKDQLLQWDMETENDGLSIEMTFAAVNHFSEKKERLNDLPPTIREWNDDFKITSASFFDKDDNDINGKITFDENTVLNAFIERQSNN